MNQLDPYYDMAWSRDNYMYDEITEEVFNDLWLADTYYFFDFLCQECCE